MARYVAVVTLHLDTQRDGRRAAEFVLDDVVRTAKGWLAVRRVEWKLDETPVTPGEAPPTVEEPDAEPADPLLADPAVPAA